MINEFKDIIVKYFEAQGKIIQKDDIVLLFYEEIKGYARGFFETTLPNFEYYEVIFDGFNNEFSLDVYQRTRTCKVTRNEE